MHRFIPFRRYNPFLKIAFNEVALDSVKTSQVPIIWLSGWSEDCVNVGYSQDIEKVTNLEEIEKRDLTLVRRQSGGGTTYLSKNGEICWAIIAPEDNFPRDINEIYSLICSKIILELQKVGIVAEHKPINDIVTENGKLSGATLRKHDGVIYIAGTMLYESNKEIMNAILRPENDDLKKESIKEEEKKITSISQESSLTFDETVNLLERALCKGVQTIETLWREEELKKARTLVDVYKNHEWIFYGKK